MPTDWNVQAAVAAEYIHDNHKEHRGVTRWKGAIAIFGNDGYRQSEKTRRQVEYLNGLLRFSDIEPLGFGLDARSDANGDTIVEEDRCYSWVLLVPEDCADIELLNHFVWSAHHFGCGMRGYTLSYLLYRKTHDPLMPKNLLGLIDLMKDWDGSDGMFIIGPNDDNDDPADWWKKA